MVTVNRPSKPRKSIRRNLLRNELVDALIFASACFQPDGLCTCVFCSPLHKLQAATGLLKADTAGAKTLAYEKPDLANSEARDALLLLSIQHAYQLYENSCEDIFDGFLEVPSGTAPAVKYHRSKTIIAAKENWHDDLKESIKRQTAFILVSTALPDVYLDNFADRVIANDDLHS